MPDTLQLKGEHIERLRGAIGAWDLRLRRAAEAIDAGDTAEAQRLISDVRAWMTAEHRA